MRKGPPPSSLAVLPTTKESKLRAATKTKHGGGRCYQPSASTLTLSSSSSAAAASSPSLPQPHPSTSDLVYGRITSISPLPEPATPPPPPPAIVYRSPRCQVDDTDLFPTQRSFDLLRRPQERWTYQSRVAGEHRQGANAFHVPPRTTPHALAAGIPKQFARQVTELHLPCPTRSEGGCHADDEYKTATATVTNTDPYVSQQYQQLLLPEWLDVVSTTFPSVRHLYLNSAGASHPKNEGEPPVLTSDGGDGEETSSSRERLQRLYVLYRLPQLLSIDGVPITDTERELARPEDPRGHRVKRDAWVRPPGPQTLPQNHHPNQRQHQQNHLEPSLQLNSMGDDLADSDDDDFDDDYDDYDDDYLRGGNRYEHEASTRGPLNATSRAGFASSELLVEVDLAGGLHLVDLMDATPIPPPPPPPPTLNLKRRGMDPPALFGVVASTPHRMLPNRSGGAPPAADELHLPYESPESSIDCEWSVACGGLSLPMMRSPALPGRRAEAADATGPDLHLLLDRRTADPKSDAPKGEKTRALSLGPRITSRESLSSPFPMQFRTRARADGTLSPSVLDPPPPPPLPPVRLSSRHRRFIVANDSIDSTGSAAIPPPPPPPSSSRRRRGHPRSAVKKNQSHDSPSRTDRHVVVGGCGVEVAPLMQVQTPSCQAGTKPKTSTTKSGSRNLPPTIPAGTASATTQRSKAIWAAKRMARSIRRRRPDPDQRGCGKDSVVGAFASSTARDSRDPSRSAATSRSILDQDTEDDEEEDDFDDVDDDDDQDEGIRSISSTGSPTASYGDEEEESDDCCCSDEENRVHLVLG